MPDVLHAHRLQTLGRMAATMAHDLRDPVASIQQTAEYLAARVEEMPRPLVGSQLRGIAASCRELMSLIDRTLTYGRRWRACLEELSLCEQIDRAGSLLRHRLREGGHTVEWRLAPDAEHVLGDAALLQQILINLMTNALRAARSGGTIRITSDRVRAEEGAPGADRIHLRVHDDGPGVPIGLADRIFDPFFTTQAGGTGLGLVAARDAALALDGTLEHEPSAQGACFLLTLRAGPTPAPEIDADPPHAAPQHRSKQLEVTE